MIFAITSFDDRGTGLTTTASCIALTLCYHFGYQVLLCDFQNLSKNSNFNMLNTHRRYLTGEISEQSDSEVGFDYLIRMASHGMLYKENIKNYTTPIGPHGLLDVTEWHRDRSLFTKGAEESGDVITRSFSQVMQLAKSVYDYVIIDFGDIPLEQINKLSDMHKVNWIIHARQDGATLDFQRALARSTMKVKPLGFLVGRALHGSRGGVLQLRSKFRAEWIGHLSVASEIANCLSEGGLERYFRRVMHNKGLDTKEGVIAECIDMCKALVKCSHQYDGGDS